MKKYNVLCDKDMDIFDTISLLNDLKDNGLIVDYTLSKPTPKIIPYKERIFIEHSNKRSIYPYLNTLYDKRVCFNIRTSFWLNYQPFKYKIHLMNETDYKYIKWLIKGWRKTNSFYDTDVSKYFQEGTI